MSGETIRVTGLAELQRAFAKFSGGMDREIRDALKEAAEPVRAEAAMLDTATIRNLGSGRWSRMRVGVTRKSVYVAPSARNRGGSPRPNLAGLLMDRAMQPALDHHAEDARRGVERLIDRMAGESGF